jgi:tetratricopeptide (TPR) repeat protein
MKHYKLAPFCLVLLLAVITCGCSKLKARDELNKGVAAYRNGQFQAAIMHFKESVRLDPTMISSRLYLATAYRQQYIPGGESADNVKIAQQALDAFEDVLKMDDKNVTAIASIAQTYFDMRKFDKAKEYQKRRLQLDPNNPEPYYWIAVLDWTECFTRAGQLRKDLKINFPTDPKDPGSMPPIPEKARTKLEEDNGPLVKEGLDALEKAIQLKPNDFDTMAYLNLMYRQKAEIESDSEARAADLKAAEDWTNKALAVRKAAGAGTSGASQ